MESRFDSRFDEIKSMIRELGNEMVNKTDPAFLYLVQLRLRELFAQARIIASIDAQVAQRWELNVLQSDVDKPLQEVLPTEFAVNLNMFKGALMLEMIERSSMQTVFEVPVTPHVEKLGARLSASAVVRQSDQGCWSLDC